MKDDTTKSAILNECATKMSSQNMLFNENKYTINSLMIRIRKNVLSHRIILPYLVIFIVSCFFKDVASVKVVALNVPSQVRKGSEVELACLYDLGNASLYSLKWFYRANDTDLDEQEFFRYTPTIHPVKQFFPLDGINVNINKSEGGRVVIVETNGKTTGKYKCEISIEGTFQTVAAEKLMTVLGNGDGGSRYNSTNPFVWILWSTILLWMTFDDVNWQPKHNIFSSDIYVQENNVQQQQQQQLSNLYNKKDLLNWLLNRYFKVGFIHHWITNYNKTFHFDHRFTLRFNKEYIL